MNRSPRFHRAAVCLVLGSAGGLALAATVSSVSPEGGRVDAAVSFTVAGTGLSNVSVQHCTLVPGTYNGTASLATFQCLPTLPGAKSVLVNGAPSGQVVAFDHPTRQGNPAARGIPSVGGVSLFNGNFFHQATDMVVPGKGPAFTLSRSYNSYSWAQEARRGGVDECRPWRFNWEVSVGWVPPIRGNIAPKSQLYVEKADGSGATFFKHSDGRWLPMDQGNFDQVEVNSLTVVVRSRDGLAYTFSAPDLKGGRLMSIMHAHNQGLKLFYGSNLKISQVQDSNGVYYRFGWDDGRLVRVDNGLATATSQQLAVAYEWDVDAELCASGDKRWRLKSVTDIRGQKTQFEYQRFVADPPPLPNTPPPPVTLLTAIVDPLLKRVVSINYSANAYGNWGVQTVANGVGDIWRFAFCADQASSLNAPEACGSTVAAKRFRTTITPPLGPQRQAYFDAAGRSAGGKDGNGRRSASESIPVLVFADPTANLTETNYNRAGLPLEVRSPLALARPVPSAQFDHDALGRMTKVLDARNKPQTTSWANPNGTDAGDPARNLFCPTQRTSAEGLVSTSVRDVLCRVTEQARPGSPASKLTYNDLGRLPTRVSTITDPRLNATTRTHDNLGNLTRIKGPEDEVTSTTYDRLGRRKTDTNALGGVTTYEYDGASNLVLKVTDPIGAITANTYDASGNLKTRTAPNGQLTTYSYDNANRLFETSTTVATANGPQVVTNKTVYDALGRVEQNISANNNASTTTFDNAGNALARANALSQATSYEYDDDNRVTQVTDPSGRVTTTIYDEAGRVTSVTTPAGSQGYDYDDDGRVVRSVDARGNATRYRYDRSTGHLVEVTDARNQITTAVYDAAGNVREIADPNRNITRFDYDKSNRRTQRTDPNGDVWRWEYDKAGNVRFARAPGGLVVEYIYDRAGQLKEQRRQPENQTVSYDYDANGNRTRMTDSTGVTNYAYDGINRLVQVTDPRGKVLKFAYDAGGNRTATTYPHNKVVAYGFDAAERLTSVTDWLGKTHRYTLNAAGQVTELALGNGTKEARSYDAATRLQSLVNTGPGNTVISSHTLQMDPNGNITEAAVQLPLLPSFGASTKTMAYDLANRLTSVNGQPVTHDSAGRLTGIGGEGYAYDSRDLLTTITGPNAGTNTYNGAGHRVARTAGGTTTQYVIDPSAGDMFSVMAENDGSGNLLRNYVYGYGLLMQISSGDTPRYYHFDSTGHTVALTDLGGAMTDRYAYTPYGETTAPGVTINPFRFAGKLGVLDDQNGLYYMRARFYSVTTKRFTGLDEVSGSFDNPETLNRYSYTHGKPITHIDGTGKTPQSAIEESNSSIGNYSSILSSSLEQYSVFGRDGQYIGKFKWAFSNGASQGFSTTLKYAVDPSYRSDLSALGKSSLGLKYFGNSASVLSTGFQGYHAISSAQQGDSLGVVNAGVTNFGSTIVGAGGGYLTTVVCGTLTLTTGVGGVICFGIGAGATVLAGSAAQPLFNTAAASINQKMSSFGDLVYLVSHDVESPSLPNTLPMPNAFSGKGQPLNFNR